VCSLLYDASRAHEHGGGGSGNKDASEQQAGEQDVSTKLDELRGARTAASEIVESGGKLYTHLGNEATQEAARTRALRFIDSIR
jgi:hypothetical protein